MMEILENKKKTEINEERQLEQQMHKKKNI